jgi:hypothetical protein
MRERQSVSAVLVGHFFRRFFDNDTVQVDGDTLTTVVRAVSIVAAPGLMVSFFLQTGYPRARLWVAIEDRYFFVLLSFVVMGLVSIFEWEMLFPDRLDFLVLSPLSLKPMQMLTAKAGALVGFLALFLVGCNLFGTMILPALTYKGGYIHQAVAHGTAVLLAGVFAALLFLALGGVLLCVLGGARFRVVSPVMQMLSVMELVLLVLHYLMYGAYMHALLSEPLGMARWMPPLWFLGLYERMLHGDAAPAFAQEMARYAIRGTWVAAGVVALTYPVAWARMRRMAIEGGGRRRGEPSRWVAEVAHHAVRRPGERAVFHFIGQTMRRNNRYQVYLAMYCGSGLALALASALTFRVVGEDVHVELSNWGLHAVMPLLLFWVVAGLRTAFAFPLNLPAGWVFRTAGVNTAECAAAARRWVLFSALGTLACVLIALGASGWGLRRLLVQAVCGLCLCVLLTDGFFYSQQSVPFNQPRMPGRTSFPLMLTLYVGVFPLLVERMVAMEIGLERRLLSLAPLALAVMLLHALAVLRRGPGEIEEEMEGYEGEFQLLGLS